MSSNMAHRQYLVNNAEKIMKNNLNTAAGNCSNIVPITNDKMPLTPILPTSIIENPSVFNKPSDLQDIFLKNYIKSAQACSSGFQY